MKKLSFKEHLESKQKLLAAISETPIQSITYDVTKYCKLVVGTKDDKQHIPLKPGQKIVVEWEYSGDLTTPTPKSITFHEVKDLANTTQFTTFWESVRLKKWLSKNSAEK